MENNNVVPDDIIKIQKKIATFEKGSRNYNKYIKILRKRVKNHLIRNRTNSNINTIEEIKKMSNN